MADEQYQPLMVTQEQAGFLRRIVAQMRNLRIANGRIAPDSITVNAGQQGGRGSVANAPDVVRFQISSDATGVGRYNIKRYSGSVNASGPSFGTLSSTEDAIGFHKAEIDSGIDVNTLKAGIDYVGTSAGTDSLTGKPVVIFSPFPVGKTSSPTTLGAASEGSESADSSTWSRDNGAPLDFWIHTRQAYFHAGDEKWYAYARKLSYDACGFLFAVSAETRIEIDAPEDC